MFSDRFQRPVRLTRHAIHRMADRAIEDALLLDVLDTGALKMKDGEHGWVFKAIEGRDDNQLCAAIQLGKAVIVKTVMHHFEET